MYVQKNERGNEEVSSTTTSLERQATAARLSNGRGAASSLPKTQDEALARGFSAEQIAALNQQQGSSAPCVIMPPPMTAAGAGAGAGTGTGAGASVGGLVHVFRATGEPWVQFCLNVTSEGNMCGGSHCSVWADGRWPASTVKLYVLCLLPEGRRLPRPARFCKAGRGVDLTFTSLKDELAALAGGGRTGGRARRSRQELCLSYK